MRRAVLWATLSFLMLASLSAYAQSYNYATMTVSSTGATASSTETVTISFSDSTGKLYKETIQYGKYDSPASVASGIAAMFTRDYACPAPGNCARGLYAESGVNASQPNVITFQLPSGVNFEPVTINAPLGPFQPSPVSWPSVSTQILLTISPNPASYGQAVSFSASVIPSTVGSQSPTGTVIFSNGSTVLGSVALSSSGIASFSNSNLSPGIYPVTATYSGDSSYLGSATATSVAVNPAAPTISLATSQTPVNHGAPVTFTATLSSGPTGTVTFLDGATAIGTGSISGNAATLSVSNLTPGTHTITASWAGNADYSPAVSGSITQVIDGILLSGQPNVITKIAGNGTTGYTGDNGQAIAAELTDPSYMATDGANNLYFCDGPALVREISSASGIITTVAGTGTAGYSNDNQKAINAEISCGGLAVDAAGDIYIQDTSSRIREVSAATGMITTVAGNGISGYTGDNGLATQASISPGHLGLDAAGNIYFDSVSAGELGIREVNASNKTISTINQTPETPQGECAFLDVSPSGTVYCYTSSPYSYGYIGVLSSQNVFTSVVEIDGGFPGWAKFDALGNLYFSQSSPSEIDKLNTTTGQTSTYLWLGQGGEGCPQQTDTVGNGCFVIDAAPSTYSTSVLAVDGLGDIYTAGFRSTIRAIDAPTPNQAGVGLANAPCNRNINYGTNVVCTVNSGDQTIWFAYPSINSTVVEQAFANAVAYSPAIPETSGTTSVTLSTSTLPVGSYSIYVTSSGDSNTLPNISIQPLTISGLTPIITWPTPASIPYGTALSSQQFNATATDPISSLPVPGTFTYTPQLGTILDAGTYTLQETFVPTDNTDYYRPTPVTRTLVVTPVVATVTWPNPAPIEYGTPLSSTQLNATATAPGITIYGTTTPLPPVNVPGTFVYSYSGGTLLPNGNTVLPVGWTTLTVTFTPNSSSNITNTSVTATARIQVLADTPLITSILANPATAGAQVTIYGQNFGPSQGSSTITLNVNGVATALSVSSWSDNSIVATLPTNATTGNVVVTVGQSSSNNFLLMISNTCP